MSQLDTLRRAVLRYLRAKGAQRDDAEDAVQNLLMKLQSKDLLAERLGDLEGNLGYFCKAAHNEWLMLLRSEESRRRRESLAASLEPQHSDDERQLTFFDIPSAKALTETQARYLEMLFYCEMSVRDIAEWHGVTERSVTGVVQRALAALRHALGDEAPPNDRHAA